MSSRYSDNQQVQLVAVDHKSLFTVVVYAYERVDQGRSERAMLHRGVLSLDFRADPDEVGRLRQLQRALRDLSTDEARAQADALELRVQREHGADRSATDLAAMTLDEVLDAGVRWSVVGKRGAPISITPQLVGLLERLYPSAAAGAAGKRAEAGAEAGAQADSPDDGAQAGSADGGAEAGAGAAVLEGAETPEAASGRRIFSAGGSLHVYRPPESVIAIYRSLSFVDRPTLDAAVDAVVGDGPDSDETASWLERDFESLTARYEVAAAKNLGLHYKYS